MSGWGFTSLICQLERFPKESGSNSLSTGGTPIVGKGRTSSSALVVCDEGCLLPHSSVINEKQS
jgi:hypothetical protein